MSELVQTLVVTDPSGKWSAHSLELVSDAAALARRWNGIAGAWALVAPAALKSDVSELARHGCSRVALLRNDRFAKWSSEAIVAALEANRSPGCRLILLPGTSRGEEVAAMLAEKLETLWIPDALTFAVNRMGSLEITSVNTGGKLSRLFRMADERPVVATMRPGVAEAKADKPAALETREVDVDLSRVAKLTDVEQFFPADPRTLDITFANKIVSGGRGTGGVEGMKLVAKLAETLGASVGASRMVVDLGWVPYERQVGQTGKTVHPDLYVACGISGASHHLAGMRDSSHIVAINPDPKAPIHEVAHLSLNGDLQQLIPEIVSVLEKRLSGEAGSCQPSAISLKPS